MTSIEQLMKEAAAATAIREAARVQLDDLNGKMRGLRDGQARELAALREMEADAIAARTEGRAVKASKIEDAKSDARLTQQAVQALQARIDAQGRALEEAEAEQRRATSAAARVTDAILFIQFANVIEAVFRRTRELTGNDAFARRLKRELAGTSAESDSTGLHVRGGLVREAVADLAGHGPYTEAVVSAVTKILLAGTENTSQLLLEALPTSADLALGSEMVTLIEQEGARIAGEREADEAWRAAENARLKASSVRSLTHRGAGFRTPAEARVEERLADEIKRNPPFPKLERRV